MPKRKLIKLRGLWTLHSKKSRQTNQSRMHPVIYVVFKGSVQADEGSQEIIEMQGV